MSEQITFEKILEVSPELAEVRRRAVNWYQHPNRWMNYEVLKSAMRKYVGRTARSDMPEFMYSVDTYDVAYKTIFKDGQDFEYYEEEDEYED